jgi:hypothetical protein
MDGTQFDLRHLTPPQTFTAADIGVVMQVFVRSGMVFLVVGLATASLFRNPPSGYRVTSSKGLAVRTPVESYSPSSDVHDPTLAPLATSVMLFCCGGGFGTMPSFNARCFGTKYMGLNYALILTAWGCAALVGPILAARAKDMTGSFAGMLPLIALLLLGAVILPFLTKKPSRRPPRPESFRSVYESLDTSPTGEFR